MIIICYVVFIAFNINHSGILPLMALNSLYCADVPLSNYSLTHSRQSCLLYNTMIAIVLTREKVKTVVCDICLIFFCM